ncbi:MAG: hypothetical protein IJM87_01905 [Ruminococcus sp.]|nr:hypothetical protein [Ruminococcus sp.]
MKHRFNTRIIFIAVVVGVYYIFLGVLLSTMEVSKSTEVISLVVPALATGSFTTILIQRMIRQLKIKKLRKAAEADEQETSENINKPEG